MQWSARPRQAALYLRTSNKNKIQILTRRAGRNTTAFRFCCVRRAAPLLHHHARAAAAAADATLSLCAAAE
jgi:hypothetical protein